MGDMVSGQVIAVQSQNKTVTETVWHCWTHHSDVLTMEFSHSRMCVRRLGGGGTFPVSDDPCDVKRTTLTATQKNGRWQRIRKARL